jgi:uncharacterized lipoprotein YddW (UPF0748 family)
MRRMALLLLACLLTPPAAEALSLLVCGGNSLDPVTAALDRLGLPYRRVEPAELTRLGDPPAEVLFLGYDAALPADAAAWSARFTDGGGKIFSYYTLPPALQLRLGVYVGDYLKPSRPYTAVDLPAGLPYLPTELRQASWNINRAYPAADSVQVIGTWRDADGLPTAEAALLLSPRGAHMTHVLLADDPAGAARLLAGLLGHFFPETWPSAVEGVLQQAAAVGGGESALIEAVRPNRRALPALAEAQGWRRAARDSLAAGRGPAALLAAETSRELTVRAYALVQPSRHGEFRGVWLHNPEGVADWGWERTCQVLAANGFNAIIANMMDAGAASYPSRYLPSPGGAADQLAEAVAAAHRHGLAFHAWKVNYNLDGADSAFVDGLRRQGRLQQRSNGAEVNWLCPSHPDNQALEIASMLEVVRDYPVDGIHFDYIRYPDADACYCDGCRDRFQAQFGCHAASWPEQVITGDLAEAFQQWRRQAITDLVRAVSVQARRLRAEIQVSAAVFADWPDTRTTIGQDWVAWAEAGYLDFVCPMDYEVDPGRFAALVTRQVRAVAGRLPLYPGIGAFRLADAAGVLSQVAATRALGADGFVLFAYDARLAREVMPLLHLGMTRGRSRPPHLGPAVTHRFLGLTPAGPAPAAGPQLESLPVQLEITVSDGIQASRARGQLSWRTFDDQVYAVAGDCGPQTGRRIETTAVLPVGDYRPVLQGDYRDGRGRRREFTWRGPWVGRRSQAFLDSVAATEAPPRLWGLGVPVGVWVEGFGGQALLAALASTRRIEPFAVHSLTPQVLAQARVIVLPQPRRRSLIGREERQQLRAWVEQGGRLLVTHDMAGRRGLLPVVPEVCRRGTGTVAASRWRAAFDHPALVGVGPGLQEHAYYDHVTLEPGRDGMVLAVDEGGQPVLVVGPHGRGWYAALGLVPGLDANDEETAPAAAESTLVQSLVRWLAEEQ